MAYSYWSEYQKALKDNKELQESIDTKEQEIYALKLQIEQLKCSCGNGGVPTTIPSNDKIGEYQQKIQQLQARVNELEELLNKCESSSDIRKTQVHTRVIEAINRAFED